MTPDGFLGILEVIDHIKSFFSRRRARKALAALSDEELHDIGVLRSEIDDVVKDGLTRQH